MAKRREGGAVGVGQYVFEYVVPGGNQPVAFCIPQIHVKSQVTSASL